MAEVKRTLDTKKKTVKKPTRLQVKTIEYAYIGDEPLDVTIKGYTTALNWYCYLCDHDQACEWLFEYMSRSEYSKSDITAAKKAPKYDIPTTVGWVARMLMNGNDIDLTYINSRIKTIIAAGSKTKEVDTATPVVNIQERTRNKIQQVITDIEESLDENGRSFSIYNFLKEREVPAAYVASIKSKYEPYLTEVSSDDVQVKEAFGKKLTTERKFWSSFVDDLDRFVGNIKSTKIRKPREKKAKSAVDLTKNLKFMKEFGPLKLVSVNPAEIVGSNQVWTYHTKTKKLTRFNAEGPSGLTINGSSIVGYSVDHSITRSIRKPEVTLAELLKAGKIQLRKFLDTLTTNETKPSSGRINSDVLILRVIK